MTWTATEHDYPCIVSKTLLACLLLRKLEGFGALCQQPGAKTKYVYLFLCHRTPITLLNSTTSKMPLGSVPIEPLSYSEDH